MAKASRTELQQSIPRFERAIELQPEYAAAHAGLSMAWSTLRAQYGQAESESRRAALNALRLDANLADAHVAMGSVHINDWEWALADKQFALLK